MKTRTKKGSLSETGRSAKQWRNPILVVALAAVTASIVMQTFSSTGSSAGGRFATTASARRGTPAIRVTQAEKVDRRLHKAHVWPKLRETLKVLGDRLEKPGKERIVMTGTLSRISGSQSESHSIRLVTELPASMRLEEQIGAGIQVTVFDGSEPEKPAHGATADEIGLIELLVFDGVDHFFEGQIQGFATRLLGERFQLDDGGSAVYRDGYYDIYEVTDPIQIGRIEQQQSKLYCFNSDTLMLEQIKYQRQRNAANVEVQLKDWREVNGQRVAHLVRLSEGGRPLLELRVTSVGFGPAAKDSLFETP